MKYKTVRKFLDGFFCRNDLYRTYKRENGSRKSIRIRYHWNTLYRA